MKRTNIYLDDRQRDLLARLAHAEGVPVAVLVRRAVDSWLESRGVRPVGEDEWKRRFRALMRRRAAAARKGFAAAAVERDVLLALKEVRRARRARRR